MSRFRRFDVVERRPSPYFLEETSIFAPPKTLTQNPHFSSFPILEDVINLESFPLPTLSLFDEFDAVTDLIQIERTPCWTSARRVGSEELFLQSLCDRVSDLELGFERLAKEENSKARKKRIGERKYTWTAEIDRPEEDRKFKWEAEINGGKGGEKKKKVLEKSYKWTAQINGKGSKHQPIKRTYTVKVQSGDISSETEYESEKKEMKKKKKKKSEKVKGKGKSLVPTERIVEIEEPSGKNGGIVLRQVFAKRLEKKRGKRIELSPKDAAALIQTKFRAYLIRRSQALRAFRELAIAKNRLKELRALFNNFTYHRRLSKDAEERQRFSEKIIVLLLTVDTIEGCGPMVRAAKRSMVDELEEMLDVVDPQPSGRPNTLMRRRTFDMPDGTINKELAAGVAQVVQMLDQDPTGSDTSEV